MTTDDFLISDRHPDAQIALDYVNGDVEKVTVSDVLDMLKGGSSIVPYPARIFKLIDLAQRLRVENMITIWMPGEDKS